MSTHREKTCRPGCWRSCWLRSCCWRLELARGGGFRVVLRRAVRPRSARLSTRPARATTAYRTFLTLAAAGSSKDQRAAARDQQLPVLGGGASPSEPVPDQLVGTLLGDRRLLTRRSAGAGESDAGIRRVHALARSAGLLRPGHRPAGAPNFNLLHLHGVDPRSHAFEDKMRGLSRTWVASTSTWPGRSDRHQPGPRLRIKARTHPA